MTKNSLRESQKAHPKTTDKRRRTSSSSADSASGDESSKSDSNGEGDSSSSSSSNANPKRKKSARSPKHVGDADYGHFDTGVHDDVVVMSQKVFLGHVECYYFV